MKKIDITKILSHVMKRHRLLYMGFMTLMALLLALLWIGCKEQSEVQPLFKQPAAQRVQQNIQELQDLLQASEHGWKLNYQPDKETGVFSFLLKFDTASSTVVMQSDFSRADLTPTRSAYAIKQGAATKLSFTTKSPLHKLSDSEISPLPNARGSGLKGSFEFLYYGKADNGEDLIFSAERGQNTVIFKPADPHYADTLSAQLASLNNLRRMVRREGYPLTIFLSATPDYSPNSVISYSLVTLNPTSRSFSITRISETANEQKLNKPYTSAFKPTPSGIRLLKLKYTKKEEQGSLYQIKRLTLKYDLFAKEYQNLVEGIEGVKSVRLSKNYASVLYHEDFIKFTNSSSSKSLYYEENTTSLTFQERIFIPLLSADSNYVRNIHPEFFDTKRNRIIVGLNFSDKKSVLIVGGYNFFTERSTGLISIPLTFNVKRKRLFIEYQSDDLLNVQNISLRNEIRKLLEFLSTKEGFIVTKETKSSLLGSLTRYYLVSPQDPSLSICFWYGDKILMRFRYSL